MDPGDNNQDGAAKGAESLPTATTQTAREADNPIAKRNYTQTTRETRSMGTTMVGVDAGALSLALEETARPRESTPTASPSRKRQRVWGDRFVANRQGQDLQASFSLLHEDSSPATPSRAKRRPANSELHFQRST